MFSSIFNVLVTIIDDGSNSEQKYEAKILRNSIQSFDFVFYKHLMKAILGITNDLSQSQMMYFWFEGGKSENLKKLQICIIII